MLESNLLQTRKKLFGTGPQQIVWSGKMLKQTLCNPLEHEFRLNKDFNKN